jgi:hypothetical protein
MNSKFNPSNNKQDSQTKLIEPDDVLSYFEIVTLITLINFHWFIRTFILLIIPALILGFHIYFFKNGSTPTEAIVLATFSTLLFFILCSYFLVFSFNFFDDLYFKRTKINSEIYKAAYIESFQNNAVRIFSDDLIRISEDYYYKRAYNYIRKRKEAQLSFKYNFYVAQDYGLRISFLIKRLK